MTQKRLVSTTVGAGALAAAIGLAVAGPVAAIGCALGFVGTAVSLFGTWKGVQWTGKIVADEEPPWKGAVVPVAAMVIKLPVILAAMWLALRLGPPAPAWFIAGLALVYSGLVWWAVSQH